MVMWVLLKSWLLQEENDSRPISRRAKASESACKRFATLVASDAGLLTVLPGNDDEGDEEEAQIMLEEATRLQALADKPVYEGEILPCPATLPKGLVENSRVAVYFEDTNLWYEGTLYHVHKSKKYKDNASVLFDDDEKHNFCWSNVDQYGRDKEFVLIPDIE